MLTIAMTLLAAAPQTQADLNRSIGADGKRADAALNAQYRAAMLVMKQRDVVPEHDPRWHQPPGPSYQDALRAAQRAWLAYRDAQCALAGYEFRGGSAEGMAKGQCLADLTRRRTAELKRTQASLAPK